LKPTWQQVQACRPWLEQEIRLVRPRVVVVMGATAAQSLLGTKFRVTQERGKVIESADWPPRIVATVHPSAVLRAPDDKQRPRPVRAVGKGPACGA
jgi:DNA polymerase